MLSLNDTFIEATEKAYTQFNAESKSLLVEFMEELSKLNLIVLVTKEGRDIITRILYDTVNVVYISFMVNVIHRLKCDYDVKIADIPTVDKYISEITDGSAYASPELKEYLSLKDSSTDGKMLMLLIINCRDILKKFKAIRTQG